MKFDNFHEAFQHLLPLIYYSPEFINAPRDNSSRERLNVNFTITNPRERVCFFPSRKTNIIFNFAEVFWYLSGSDSLEYIEYYCKNMRKYSLDGHSLKGCAYGPKIFGFGKDRINQWKRVKKLLLEDDPSSKRAMIQIFDANEELNKSNIDVTCTIGLQFFLRDEKLFLSGFMRANDCFRGIVSDIFSFTFMQELLASELNVEMGTYHHSVGSMHTYEHDDKHIQKVLKEIRNTKKEFHQFKFPQMPHGNNWTYINSILEIEKELRKNKLKLEINFLDKLKLPEYWEQILLLFGIYRDIVYDNSINLDLWQRLSFSYQYLLENKWPSLTQSFDTGVRQL